MSFVSSKWAGDVCENLVAQYLISLDDTVSVEKAQWKFYDWDLKRTTKDKEETYEIKSDRKSEYTNNFCIEFMNTKHNELSGIFRSQADYVVYYAWKKWRKANRVELILKILSEKKHDVRDGWDENSRMYIFPVDRIWEFFSETLDIPEIAEN